MAELDAIADPVRLAIVRHLAAHGPAALSDLADVAGVHGNTVRPHLVALEQAGLVAREQRLPAGRGRGPVEYRLVEGWAVSASGFLGLAELLAMAVLSHPPGDRDLRLTGRRWGAQARGRSRVGDPLRQVLTVLERLGFQAQMEKDSITLTGCPCPLVAPNDPKVVCQLVVGAVEGVGEEEHLRVVRRAHDPARRRCRLNLTIPSA